MTELLDKDRIERLEKTVVSLRARLDDLERTVFTMEAELRRLFEAGLDDNRPGA